MLKKQKVKGKGNVCTNARVDDNRGSQKQYNNVGTRTTTPVTRGCLNSKLSNPLCLSPHKARQVCGYSSMYGILVLYKGYPSKDKLKGEM